jgi:hypothetical protein
MVKRLMLAVVAGALVMSAVPSVQGAAPTAGQYLKGYDWCC